MSLSQSAGTGYSGALGEQPSEKATTIVQVMPSLSDIPAGPFSRGGAVPRWGRGLLSHHVDLLAFLVAFQSWKSHLQMILEILHRGISQESHSGTQSTAAVPLLDLNWQRFRSQTQVPNLRTSAAPPGLL